MSSLLKAQRDRRLGAAADATDDVVRRVSVCRRVWTAGAALSLLATMTTGCDSSKDEARTEAMDDMRAELAEITDTATELIKTESPETVSRRVEYLYGDKVYQRSATKAETTVHIVLTADASYSAFIGEHQAIVGTCIGMTVSKADGVNVTTMRCPKGLWKRDAVDNYGEQVDILDD